MEAPPNLSIDLAAAVTANAQQRKHERAIAAHQYAMAWVDQWSPMGERGDYERAFKTAWSMMAEVSG